jgi:copper chaperone CopZ
MAEAPPAVHVLQVAAGILLVAGTAWFAVLDLRAKAGLMRQRLSPRSFSLEVEDIGCSGCESRIRAALLELEGVRGAVVSRDSGTAVLSIAPGFDPEKALELVKGLGHAARSLRPGSRKRAAGGRRG